MGHSDINYSRIPEERINPALLEEVPELVAAPGSRRREELSKKLKNLSVVEIAFGIIAILLQIIIIVLNADNWSILGSGIWSGTFLLITGSLGVTAEKNPSPKIYNANLVLSILSAVAVSVVISFSTMGAVNSGLWFNGNSSPSGTLITAAILSCILVFVGLTGMAMSITHSTFFCKGVCCINTEPQMVIVQNSVDPHQMKQMVQLADGRFVLAPTQLGPDYGHVTRTSPACSSSHASGIPHGICQREEMTATTWENPPNYSEDPDSDSQMLVA